MFVLGIDPGLTRTGYGLVRRGRGLEAVAAGVIRTDPAQPMAARLLELERDLAAVIAEHQPDVAAIERVFTNRNRQTAIAVGRASGVVLLTAARAGLEVAEARSDRRRGGRQAGRRRDGGAPPGPSGSRRARRCG